jgi:hypothetical protein
MNTELEHLALNQTLFNKNLIIGKGFVEGEQTFPDKSFDFGWWVFVNGRSKIPEITSEIKEKWEIGVMYYPNLLTGMPSLGGWIKYSLIITEEEWQIIVGVKLDDNKSSSSEFIEDIASIMFLEHYLGRGEFTIGKLAKELLMPHFLVFMGLENPREIYSKMEIEHTDENSVLIESIQEFIELAESNKISYDTWNRNTIY